MFYSISFCSVVVCCLLFIAFVFALELKEEKYAYNTLWADDDDEQWCRHMCTKNKWVSKYRASKCDVVHWV